MSDIRNWVRQQGAPVTLAVIASLIVSSLALWFSHLRGMEQLVFTSDWPARPWTLLTYPWAYMPLGSGFDIIGFLFLIMWMLWVGGSVEREMGSKRYGVVLLTMVLLPALVLWGGAKAMNVPLVMGAPWLPEAGITVLWCTRNPRAQIMMYGIIPLSGKWLGWLTVAIVLLTMGMGNPVLGALACVHLALAWAFAEDRLPVKYRGIGTPGWSKKEEVNATRGQIRYDEKYYAEVRKREQEREERERLRKLLGE